MGAIAKRVQPGTSSVKSLGVLRECSRCSLLFFFLFLFPLQSCRGRLVLLWGRKWPPSADVSPVAVADPDEKVASYQ